MNDEIHDAHTDEAIEQLGRLIQLEYDTMAAYRAAMGRVDSTASRGDLELSFEDHDETARALASCITRYGGKPNTGDLERAWKKGGEVVGSARGDVAVLVALAEHENEVHRAYERAQEHLRPVADPSLASVIAAALAEDEQHRRRLAHAIDSPPPA
jgi:bacterioferritin (cytochrome b1)